MEESVFVIIAVGVAALFGLWVIFYFIPVGLWMSALLSGVQISIMQLVFMRWRKVPPQLIVRSMIACAKGGIIVSQDQLEVHYLARGNLDNVVEGLIYANARAIKLSFEEAAQMDLARKDIIEECSKRKSF